MPEERDGHSFDSDETTRDTTPYPSLLECISSLRNNRHTPSEDNNDY